MRPGPWSMHAPAGRGRPGAVVLALLLLAGCASGAGPGAPDGQTDPAADVQTPPEGAGTARQPRLGPSLAGSTFGARVARAVQTSPDLAAGGARIGQARAAEAAEKGAFLPQISLGAEAGSRYVGGRSTDTATPVLQISQLVYDGGAARARGAGARARSSQSRSDWLESAATLTYQAVGTWHEVVSRRRLQALASENLAAHRRIMALIEDRAGSGAGSEIDILVGQARLADAVSREVEARARLERTEAAFVEMFGAAPGALAPPPPAPALPGSGSDTGSDTGPGTGPDFGLIRRSPRMEGLNAAVAAAEADLEAAMASRLPRVSLAAAGRRARDGDPDLQLGLSLDYDLGTEGRRAAAIEAAEARLAEAGARREGLERQIRRALDEQRAERRAGAARLAAARQSAAAHRATLAAAEEQFGIGRRSLVDLLDAQRDVMLATEAEVGAARDLALTGYAVLALTGDILDVFGIRLPELAEARSEDQAGGRGGARR